MLQKSWILSYDDFRILLFNCGYTECEGIYMEEKEFSDVEVIQSLNRMALHQWIYIEEDAFEIEKDLKKAIRTAGSPAYTQIRKGLQGREYFLYFDEDSIVISQPYYERKGMLKLTLMDQEAFHLWEEDIQ